MSDLTTYVLDFLSNPRALIVQWIDNNLAAFDYTERATTILRHKVASFIDVHADVLRQTKTADGTIANHQIGVFILPDEFFVVP
jgi:hypothetical protein